MKLIDLKCSNCGATMQVNPDLKQVSCNYCGNTMLVDDEVKKMELINGLEYGYQQEQGRQKARRDYEQAQKSKRFTTKAIVFLVLFVAFCISCAITVNSCMEDSNGVGPGVAITIILFACQFLALNDLTKKK